MSERKRKRQEETSGARSDKKLAVGEPQQTVKVSVIADGDEWTPVLASSPGLSLPSNPSFKPYTRARANVSRHSLPGTELLLHSSVHPKLNYTAREESFNGSSAHLKHYIGAYDPLNGKLQLVQARKVVVRGTLRSAAVSSHDKKDRANVQGVPNTLSARSSLGLAFGTKKSQNAIRALTANAIQPPPSISRKQDSPDKRPALDPLASAVVSSMAVSTSSMPTPEEMQKEIDEGKPCPKANLHAETRAEVYPVEELVGGFSVLKDIGVKEWVDKINAGEDVQTKSLFVARRLRQTVQAGDVKRIKALKYLLLLVEWFKSLKSGVKGAKKVPKLEEMPDLVAGWGSDIVNSVGHRFAEGNFVINKWHQDNLITHIMALTLVLDNFTTDTHDIREDLKLESKDISKYYRELGCGVSLPTDTERTHLQITKAETAMHRIATLKLPLEILKPRIPAARRKKR